jgi:anti-anti-sigma regulatory factor
MSAPSARMLVWTGEKCSCIRIIGRANFTSSVDFKSLINELLQRGRSYLMLDLAECALMDSTFLGVLTGFGLKLSAGNGDNGHHGIELVNPNARITELLDTLGVLHLFKLTQGPLPLPDQAEVRPHTPGTPTKEEVTHTCIEAHRILSDLSPENAAKFKDVAQFLAEGLKKPKSE